MRLLLSIVIVAVLSGCMANVEQQAVKQEDNTAGPLSAVHALHDALVNGDEAAARQALAPEVLIYESGGAETLDQYAAGHMKGDMAFLKAIQIQKLDEKQTLSRDLAMVTTRSRMTGEYKGKKLDLFSTETMVLKREPDGWRIVHIHWSSQPAAKAH
jgi:ketosteroid isomerase-like protein